ncbi:MAG TPA: hypothetical protein VFQ44_02355 [Streptosporangiaceae bacterium]|nr:hypothetical protein [Streptosporangiaceae bacterium]
MTEFELVKHKAAAWLRDFVNACETGESAGSITAAWTAGCDGYGEDIADLIIKAAGVIEGPADTSIAFESLENDEYRYLVTIARPHGDLVLASPASALEYAGNPVLAGAGHAFTVLESAVTAANQMLCALRQYTRENIARAFYREQRLAQLRKLPKAQLAAMYQAGIRTPSGGFASYAGSAHPLESWGKDELVSVILGIEYPEAA